MGGQLIVWATLLGEGAPLLAALVVSAILARSRFREKMLEYREDTLMLLQVRAQTIEKQLADARTEIDDMRSAAQQREQRIADLEEAQDPPVHALPSETQHQRSQT